MFAVYALIDPRDSAIRYVGMTRSVDHRVQRHVRNCAHSDTPRDIWLRELRDTGLRPDCLILEEYRDHDACDAGERYWIRRAVCRGLDLLNRTAGGQRGCLSDESRAKIGEKNRGRRPSAEARAKMSAAAKARVPRFVSNETRARISAANKGKGHGPEWRAARAQWMRGRKAPESTREKMRERACGNKRALRYSYTATSPSGEVFEFTDMRAFAEQHGLTFNGIRSAVRRGLANYGWRFERRPLSERKSAPNQVIGD